MGRVLASRPLLEGLCGAPDWSPNRLALCLYQQLNCDALDDKLAEQAVKCLVALAGAPVLSPLQRVIPMPPHLQQIHL